MLMNIKELKKRGVVYLDLLNNTAVYKDSYGTLIQMVKTRRDIPYTQVCREMGVAQNTLHYWVKGYQRPTERFIPVIKQWLSKNGVTL